MASFLHNTKIGVPVIDSIPHCQTKNALKRDKNQEMWLRCYIEDSFITIKKIKLENVSSIVFHTVILKMLGKEAKIKKCGFVAI